MAALEERDLINTYLAKYTTQDRPVMMQIGANEGKYEYSKKDGKDFIFEFLLHHPHWQATLIEPLPDVFDKLKENYSGHQNVLSFLNCAVTSKLEELNLHVVGKDGKSSSFYPITNKPIKEIIRVKCLPYQFLCAILGLRKVDFVKIDAEGYDEQIVLSILETENEKLLPKIIFWESLKKHSADCEEQLTRKGYEIFLTGLNKLDKYMDRVAIHQSLL